MAGYSDPGFDTLALHAGAAPDPATGARAVPIHLTTSFVFENSEHAASLFNMERSGHVYSRLSNPTNAVPAEAIAHEHGLPLLVDSTFTTPYLMKPFEHGADLVYHSATKFLSGHGTVVGGVLVDSGQFDWEASGRFPELTTPYEGFHGMVFSEESTVGAFLLRARREGLRDFGACMSPHTAWLILQGIETLPLRMERHVANTRRVVEFLVAHPMVASVAYPELDGHPSRELARRLLPHGCGS